MERNKEKENKDHSPISLLAQFTSTPLEQKYREHYLKSEKLQLAIAICVILIPNFIFSYSDYLLFGNTSRFYYLIAIRAVHITLSTIILLVLNRIKKYQTFDIVAFSWWISLITLIFLVNFTRPAGYTQNSIIDMLILFAIYILVRNRLVLQIFPALMFSLVNIVFIITSKTSLKPLALIVVLVSYVLANVLGIFVARRLHVSGRIQFAALLNEKQLRKKLEHAISEIKTLQGIIPICSKCKKIRDDGGYWQQLEVYISDHSDADFSHSLCPHCVEELYPGVDLDE